jgi:hypothetical protein
MLVERLYVDLEASLFGELVTARQGMRCEQCRGAMPLVVVALPGQGASVWQLQIALRPLQGLDRRSTIRGGPK